MFLDRDGTLVHPRHYPRTPDELVLYDGIGASLRTLQRAGLRLVVVTNQAGVARGYVTEMDLARMHGYLRDELSLFSVRIDGIYYCPHHVEGVVPELRRACRCRKPEPGMLLQAAQDLDLDLSASWMVGDILDDVEAGNRAGCRTILVDVGTESAPENPVRCPSYVARDTLHALAIIASVEQLGPAANLAYSPATWHDISEPRAAAVGGGYVH